MSSVSAERIAGSRRRDARVTAPSVATVLLRPPEWTGVLHEKIGEFIPEAFGPSNKPLQPTKAGLETWSVTFAGHGRWFAFAHHLPRPYTAGVGARPLQL